MHSICTRMTSRCLFSGLFEKWLYLHSSLKRKDLLSAHFPFSVFLFRAWKERLDGAWWQHQIISNHVFIVLKVQIFLWEIFNQSIWMKWAHIQFTALCFLVLGPGLREADTICDWTACEELIVRVVVCELETVRFNSLASHDKYSYIMFQNLRHSIDVNSEYEEILVTLGT